MDETSVRVVDSLKWKHEQSAALNELARQVHIVNDKWWRNIETNEPIQRNVGELLALVHSEISEALEGHRKNLMDDKLPHRKMFEVELADAIIRIFDIAAGLNLDLGGAYVEKMTFNAQREDHKHEARLAANGKKY
jgi:hypothetical protein